MGTPDTFKFLSNGTVDIFNSFTEDALEGIGLFTMKNTSDKIKEIQKEHAIQLTEQSTDCKDTVKVYHVADIEKILDISRTAAYALINKAPFRVVRIGSSIRISKEDFDRWLNDSEQRRN